MRCSLKCHISAPGPRYRLLCAYALAASSAWAMFVGSLAAPCARLALPPPLPPHGSSAALTHSLASMLQPAGTTARAHAVLPAPSTMMGTSLTTLEMVLTAASTLLVSASIWSSAAKKGVPAVKPAASASASAFAASASSAASSLPAWMACTLSALTASAKCLRWSAGMTADASIRDSSAASGSISMPVSFWAAWMRAAKAAASACAASALSPVRPTMRRTPPPMPSSDSSTKERGSDERPMWVPPQNSMEKSRHSGVSGEAIISPTPGPPTVTTRTGSGYCSPKTARRPLIVLAESSATTCVCTARSALICRLTASCAAASCSTVRGLLYAKSKRSLSASHSEPRWSASAPSASRSAWLSMWVDVWLRAIGARRV
mmetsp:Transcript_1474/g.4727  ORF Transcript_1474/g.4727 Transcript_1474/m.4727 type:complete len:376 (+) Transcript_1474:567-1694(+)